MLTASRTPASRTCSKKRGTPCRVDAIPVRRVVVSARRMADVVARREYERLEPRKLGAWQTAGQVIARQELERRHAGARRRGLARRDGDLVTECAKRERRVAADQSRPADDEHSHADSVSLRRRGPAPPGRYNDRPCRPRGSALDPGRPAFHTDRARRDPLRQPRGDGADDAQPRIAGRSRLRSARRVLRRARGRRSHRHRGHSAIDPRQGLLPHARSARRGTGRGLARGHRSRARRRRAHRRAADARGARGEPSQQASPRRARWRRRRCGRTCRCTPTTPGCRTATCRRRSRSRRSRGVIEEYAHAARLARGAGFDGVELHAASGYLPMQFLAANSNLRRDAYGGVAANRARFAVEVMEALCGAIGPGRVGMRICPANPFNDVARSGARADLSAPSSMRSRRFASRICTSSARRSARSTRSRSRAVTTRARSSSTTAFAATARARLSAREQVTPSPSHGTSSATPTWCGACATACRSPGSTGTRSIRPAPAATSTIPSSPSPERNLAPSHFSGQRTLIDGAGASALIRLMNSSKGAGSATGADWRTRARPEFLPAREQLVITALVRRNARPAHLVGPQRWLVEIGRVPVERQPSAEVPAPGPALVVVDVHHLHDHPLGAGLVLVLRVHDAAGVIGVLELDHVIPDVVRGAGELHAQRAYRTTRGAPRDRATCRPRRPPGRARRGRPGRACRARARTARGADGSARATRAGRCGATALRNRRIRTW